MSSDSQQKTQEKWITTVIWLAVLGALVYTSGYAVSIVASISGMANLMKSWADSGLYGVMPRSNNGITVFAGVIGTAIAAYHLLNSWTKFATVTNELLVAYARSKKADIQETVFDSLLVFEDLGREDTSEETELNPDDANSTLISDVIKPLGIAWIALLATPALVGLLGALLG